MGIGAMSRSGGPAAADGLIEIVSGLQIHPQLGGSAERFGQVQRRVRRDAALALDQFVQPCTRPAEFPGKLRLRNAGRLQEFFEQYFAGMKRILGLFRRLAPVDSFNGNRLLEHLRHFRSSSETRCATGH